MSVAFNFDLGQHDPADDEFAPLAAGQYKVVITDFEDRVNKRGNGSHSAVTMEVIEGEHKGRNLWTNLNLNNANQRAVKLAKDALHNICNAVGVAPSELETSDQLVDKPLMVSIFIQESDGQHKARNEVADYGRAFFPVNGQASQAQPEAPAQPAPEQASRRPNW